PPAQQLTQRVRGVCATEYRVAEFVKRAAGVVRRGQRIWPVVVLAVPVTAHALLPLRLRGPARLPIPPSLRRLPSSLVPRSSVQAATRPFGASVQAAPRPFGSLTVSPAPHVREMAPPSTASLDRRRIRYSPSRANSSAAAASPNDSSPPSMPSRPMILARPGTSPIRCSRSAAGTRSPDSTLPPPSKVASNPVRSALPR